MSNSRNVQRPWQSFITDVEEGHLSTHGVDQQDIIRNLTYEAMIFLLFHGRPPSDTEETLLGAVIRSHCSHGITGHSTIATRAAADCGTPLLHSLIAGFSAGAGPYHQGGLESAMRELQWANTYTRKTDGTVADYVEEQRRRDRRLIGFGHRFHRNGDPRARTLLSVAEECDAVGTWIATAQTLEEVLLRHHPQLYMNIEAAGGAILLELGFPAEYGPLIIMVGRAPMLAAAYFERYQEGTRPFQPIAVYDKVDPQKE